MLSADGVLAIARTSPLATSISEMSPRVQSFILVVGVWENTILRSSRDQSSR